MAAVIVHSDFGAQEIKSVTVSIVSPSICHEVLGRVLYKWKSAIDWRFVFPQNSHAEILTSKGSISWIMSTDYKLFIFYCRKA